MNTEHLFPYIIQDLQLYIHSHLLYIMWNNCRHLSQKYNTFAFNLEQDNLQIRNTIAAEILIRKIQQKIARISSSPIECQKPRNDSSKT